MSITKTLTCDLCGKTQTFHVYESTRDWFNATFKSGSVSREGHFCDGCFRCLPNEKFWDRALRMLGFKK